MKQKSQQKRNKKRQVAVKSSGDKGTACEGNKKDVEEDRKDGECTKRLENNEKNIESLMEAFCSVSMEETMTAYKEACGDVNKAAEILSDLVENGDDPSTGSVASCSSGQETACTSEYGAGSSSSGSEDLTRERWFKGNKQSRVIAATGMVSSVIAKDYLNSNSVRKEFPMVERSKELCGKGKKAADRENAEQFLSSMLGEDCELSMAVVRDVLCQCGYDVDMAFNVLLDMSSSPTDDSLSGKCFGIGVSDSQTETSFDTDTSESELFWGTDYSQSRDYAKVLTSSEDPFATSQGSNEFGLPQKVLESLFNIRQRPNYEPKTMDWRNVAKKLQSLGVDAPSSSGEDARSKTFGILL